MIVADLEYVIKLILLYPQGLSILLGQIAPPESLALVQAFPGRVFDNFGIRGRIQSQEERIIEAADRIDDIIRRAGGWGHIVASIQIWRQENPTDWSLMAAHISWVRRGQRWIGRAKLRKLAENYECSEHTITRKRRLFPGVLADYILHRTILSVMCP
jgi:hypothetical protein